MANNVRVFFEIIIEEDEHHNIRLTQPTMDGLADGGEIILSLDQASTFISAFKSLAAEALTNAQEGS